VRVNFSAISQQRLFGRLLRLPLRLLPGWVVVPILQGPLRGRRWIVGAATHGCWLGSYEMVKQRIVASLLRPGDVVYDLGANVGFYTLLASVGVGPTGKVHAFDPFPENVRFLHRHVQLNRLGNVFVHQCAVSDASGLDRFAGEAGRCGGRLSPRGDLSVRTVTLDDFVFKEKRPMPCLMKVDIEGGEVRALRGARQTLAQGRTLLFVATHGAAAHTECCELLTSLNYSITSVEGASPESSNELLARPLRFER